MNPKPLKDMDFNEVVDEITWNIVRNILHGELRNAVHAGLMLHDQWRKEKINER